MLERETKTNMRRDAHSRYKQSLIAGLAATLVTVGVATPARAGDVPTIAWTGGNAYVWGMGDSLFEQCRENLGLGWRSLGMVGWPGATSTDMRNRMSSTSENWPWITEASHAEELVWFRDAGAWLIGLGTNDARVGTPVEQFRANIDWFMQKSGGRPVEWFDIHNPPYQAHADRLNAELRAATDRWPNLKILPWHAWALQNPSALLSDQVHVATYEYGCQQGRHKLAFLGMPDEPGKTAPDGYLYGITPRPDGQLRLNGWGAPNVPNKLGTLQVNLRSDYQHVGRWPVQNATTDLYAQAASGRGFDFLIDPGFRNHLLCVDLVDSAGQFTSLGCLTVR
jgi:hypothetical protein